MRITSRGIGWGAMLIILAAAILTIAVIYQLLWPPKVLKVNQASVPPTVTRDLPLTLNYCKYHPLDSRMTISFVDDALLPSFNTIVSLPVGCHTVTKPINIPATVPAGHYYLIVEIDYHINSLGSEHHEIHTNKFEVTK